MRIYRSSHTSTSSRLTWRNEIPAARIVHNRRENRFQGGGQNPFQARDETEAFLPREIKKHEERQPRVKEWATEFHMTELEHPVLPGA